jgi:thiol-disulfide isomerase/thioredoxin
MLKIMKRLSVKNIILLIIIILLMIPQSRQQIQIVLHKGFAMFSPSVEPEDSIKQVSTYNWMLKDLEGNTFDLNTSKGRVTLINLWATWCPPCIAEMPSIQALSTDYKDKIDIILVSNEDQEVVKQFLKEKSYDLQVYTPTTEAPETFDVKSIPRTFLLDRKGNIIIDESGAANWNSEKVRNTIDDLLKL